MRKILSPVKEAVDSSGKFDDVVQRTIKLFRRRHSNQEDVDKSFNEFLQNPYDKTITRSTVENLLSEAVAAQQKVAYGRKKGPRAVANQFVNFAGTFSKFLAAFSGIVEIVKGVDDQWGGLAYGTLSVLLIVCS